MMEKIDRAEVPGDTHLVEIEKKKEGLDEEVAEILLIPTPSDDPNDPLNWSPFRKQFHMFCLVVYVYGIGVPTTVIYSVLTDISGNTDIPISDLNAGTGYMFLFLGIGCLIFLPLSLQYGKRPIYLFSSLGCCLISVWQPYATSNGTWIASKILQGLLASPVEALPEVSVSDLFFEHERSTWMGVYAMALFSSNYLAPLISGFINDAIGWRWVINLSCIWNAVVFVFIFFFMEETKFERRIPELRDPDPTNEILKNTKKIDLKKGGEVSVSHTGLNAVAKHCKIDERVNHNIPMNSRLKRLSLYTPSQNFGLWKHFASTAQMAQFPVVLWSGFLYGSALIWYSVMNATLALVFTSEPYNFSTAMTGLVYISPLVFTGIFYSYSGYMLDYLKVRIAKRRDGYSKPEDRLWSLLLYMILGPASLILWGVGAYHQIHWFGLVIGCGIMGGLAPLGCNVGVTYAVDSYHEMSCESMAIVIIIRNLMSFAVNYGITPWISNMGYQNAFITAAFICLFCFGTFLLMIVKGPYWRKKSRNAYWKLVAKKATTFSQVELVTANSSISS